MSYRMARTLSRIAKLGEKAVARSNCAQNRNILFKCPRWSHSLCQEPSETDAGTSTLVGNDPLSVQNRTNLPDTLVSAGTHFSREPLQFVVERLFCCFGH